MRRGKFTKIYKAFHEPIYRFIYFRVRGAELAEDLASEVFIKFWQYAKFNKIENHRALLYRLSRGLLSDYYRKRKTLPPVAEQTSFRDAPTLDIAKAIAQLKSHYQEAITLFYIEGYSHKEISEILNKSEGAIRVLVFRGLKKLKEKM